MVVVERDGSQHWGPMQGCRRWSREGGVWGGWVRGYRVLQGAERGERAGHGWQRSIPSVCGHAVSQLRGAQSPAGCRAGFTGITLQRVFIFGCANHQFIIIMLEFVSGAKVK